MKKTRNYLRTRISFAKIADALEKNKDIRIVGVRKSYTDELLNEYDYPSEISYFIALGAPVMEDLLNDGLQNIENSLILRDVKTKYHSPFRIHFLPAGRDPATHYPISKPVLMLGSLKYKGFVRSRPFKFNNNGRRQVQSDGKVKEYFCQTNINFFPNEEFASDYLENKLKMIGGVAVEI